MKLHGIRTQEHGVEASAANLSNCATRAMVKASMIITDIFA